MAAIALLAPRLTARDQTLPPLPLGSAAVPTGPDSVGPFSHLFASIQGWTSAGPQSFERLAPALRWALNMPASTRVYVLSAEMVLAALLWSNAPELESQVWQAFNTGRWLPLLDAAQMVSALNERELPPALWSNSTPAELGHLAQQLENWFSVQPVSQSGFSLSPTAVNERLRHHPGVFPLSPPPGGVCGLAWSVAAKGMGMNLAWHGIRVDEAFVRDASLEPTFEPTAKQRDSLRRLSEIAASVRPDGRIHPYYNQQAYLRLGAKSPNYQGLSGQPALDERRALLPEHRQILYSLDVSMAELVLAGVYWARFFNHTKLLELITEEGRDIHRESGERLAAKVRVPDEYIRNAGKLLNLALSNLGGAKDIAKSLADDFNTDVSPEVAQTVLNEIGTQFPYAQWADYCRRIAFESSKQERAHVQTLSGRWLTLQAKPRSRKPSGAAVASALTQGGFADSHAAGLFALWHVLPRGSVLGTLFDEVLLSLPESNSESWATKAAQAYLMGAQAVTGMPGLRVALRRHGVHWRA